MRTKTKCFARLIPGSRQRGTTRELRLGKLPLPRMVLRLHRQLHPRLPPNSQDFPAQLTLGMTRDEVVAAMGTPQRETSFEGRAWLTYPNMVVVLEDGKLKSIDQAVAAPAKVAIHSTPDGAEI